MTPREHPIRVVLAKLGLDGHDRGIQVVARSLRDAGMEVIYTGLWQAAETVVQAVVDEDADVLGVSLLSGAHLTIIPEVAELLRKAGREDAVLVVGGIVPDADRRALEELGVDLIFGPGTAMADIVRDIEAAVQRQIGR